jgi:hypothetical protein
MKKIALYLGLFLCILSLAACGTDEQNSEAPQFTIDYASAENLSDTSDTAIFVADDSEYRVDVLLSPTAPVKNLKILAIELKDADEKELYFSINQELYTQPELAAETPFILGMVFAGDTPNMGISYEDQNGQTHYYAIGMSGQDGSLFLQEFTPAA